VEEILLTGGIQTYNKIMWGNDHETRQRNLATGVRQFAKRFDAELGGVTPVIIVPGQWTDAELDHHAAQVVAALLHRFCFWTTPGRSGNRFLIAYDIISSALPPSVPTTPVRRGASNGSMKHIRRLKNLAHLSPESRAN
jgi:hypothetical protein